MISNIETPLFFDAIFNNAQQNSIIIMDVTGKIIQVNKAFSHAFGYLSDDVNGKNFEMLFTANDRKLNKPELELARAKESGSANDENYLVHKDGTAIWVTGECIAVENADNEWLVKIIHNINASKQLERFLEEAEEIIESFFDLNQPTGLLLLDMRLKVIKVNKAFLQLFNLKEPPSPGASLGSIHPFWNDPKVKECVREIIIKNKSLKDCFLEVAGDNCNFKYKLGSKTITDNSLSERRIMIVVHEA